MQTAVEAQGQAQGVSHHIRGGRSGWGWLPD
jgi:hypothetical protein